MPDLDLLLRAADPADLHPTAVAEALALATCTAEPGVLPDLRPQRRRRLSRPAVIGAVVGGLVLTGGVAAAAPALFDFFGTDSPVVSTVQFEVPGADASCSLFLNVVPADGTTHTDVNGLNAGGGSAATFDRADFDAVEAFVRSHDWSGVVAEVDPFAGTNAGTDPDGTVTVEGNYVPGVSAAVEQVLAENGLNTTRSAILVETTQCGIRS